MNKKKEAVLCGWKKVDEDCYQIRAIGCCHVRLQIVIDGGAYVPAIQYEVSTLSGPVWLSIWTGKPCDSFLWAERVLLFELDGMAHCLRDAHRSMTETYEERWNAGDTRCLD